MRATERSLDDIVSDIFYETVGAASLQEFEFVVDQRFMCPLHDRPESELTELATTRHPMIVQAVVEGGSPKNRYEVTIQPKRRAVR